MLAITLAHEGDRLSLGLDTFLARFLKHAPAEENEVEAYALLAQLYERHGIPESAAEIYVKLSVVRPSYAEAAQRLRASLAPATAERSVVAARAVSGFQRRM